MGATYTRQSSYSDGDVIQASDTNNEFDQLLAAFAASSGHTHDGTTGEGGPITKLLGTSLTLGDGTAGTDITVTFDGESNDGVLKWMEDEDYFEFSDDILVASTEKIQFGDTASFIQQSSDGVLRIDGEATINLNASSNVDVSNDMRLRSDSSVISFGADSDVSITHVADTALLLNSSRQLQFGDSGTYIHQSTDGQLDLVADTEIQIAATTIDINGNVDISGTLTIGSAGISEAELEILDGATVTTAELNLLDGVTSTTTELNIIDGDSSIGTTTVSDGHGIVMNHGGTMAQTTVQTLAAYLDDEITAMPNLVTTAATTVGALNSGSITSGFGAIDNGSSAITTTGTITYGNLSDGTITITAFVDEDDMSSNSATLVPTQQSVKAYVDTQITAEDLDVTSDSGTIAIDLDSETFTIAGGEGIDTSATGNTVTIAGEDATTSNKGVASFSSDNFAVSSGAVTIKDGGVVTAELAADAVTGAKIADDAIDSEHYTDGSIDTAHLGDLQVTTAKIAADAITGAKIADDAINSEHYTDGSIDTAHLGDLQVTTAKIAADAITGAKIADDAINSEHYTDGSIDTAHIADSQITTAKIAADAITEAKIADNAVESEHINDNVISGQTELASGLATTDELLVSDAGTIKRMDVSVLTALTDDNATALAIALG